MKGLPEGCRRWWRRRKGSSPAGTGTQAGRRTGCRYNPAASPRTPILSCKCSNSPEKKIIETKSFSYSETNFAHLNCSFRNTKLSNHLINDVVDACADVVQDHAAGEFLAAGDDGAQRAVLGIQLVLLQRGTRVAGELVEEVVQAEVHPDECCQDPADGYAPICCRQLIVIRLQWCEN